MEQDYKQKAIEFAEGILKVSDEFWDDPNGPYTYTCPFCGRKRYDSHTYIHEEHTFYCLRTIAEDFLKNI